MTERFYKGIYPCLPFTPQTPMKTKGYIALTQMPFGCKMLGKFVTATRLCWTKKKKN